MSISFLPHQLRDTKEWDVDDKPHMWEGIAKDISDVLSWDKVEYCLNNPQFFRVNLPHNNIPHYYRNWGDKEAYLIPKIYLKQLTMVGHLSLKTIHGVMRLADN